MIPDTTSSPAPSFPPEVVCRRPRSDWWAISVFLFFAVLTCTLLFVIPRKAGPADYIVIGVLALPWILAAAYYARLTPHGRITADAAGIRRRTVGRERFVRWDDIQDYYLVPVKSRDFPYVQTAHGKWSFSDWTNRDALMKYIVAHARNTSTTDWDHRGVRPGDEWPQTFSYDSPELKWMPLVLIGTVLIMPLQIFSRGSWSQIAGQITMLWNYSSPGMAIGTVLFTLLAFSAQPALILVILLPRWRTARRHIDERFIATTTELTYYRGASSQVFRWSDVTAYYRCSTGKIQIANLFVLETAHGKVQWFNSLRHSDRLARIVKRYATAAETRSWAEQEDIAAKQAAQELATGEQTFTFQNATNRAMIWLACAMCGLPALMFVLPHLLPAGTLPVLPNSRAWSFAFLTLPLWMWWCYRKASVTLSLDGILQRSAFGDRFVAWTDLQSTATVGADLLTFYRVAGANSNLYIYPTIERFEVLKTAIEERLPATESVVPGIQRRP